MKKTTLVTILAALAWSIQACTNRNNDGINNTSQRGDSLNYDTMITPPSTNNNQRIDTMNNQFDTTNINQDTL